MNDQLKVSLSQEDVANLLFCAFYRKYGEVWTLLGVWRWMVQFTSFYDSNYDITMIGVLATISHLSF